MLKGKFTGFTGEVHLHEENSLLHYHCPSSVPQLTLEGRPLSRVQGHQTASWLQWPPAGCTPHSGKASAAGGASHSLLSPWDCPRRTSASCNLIDNTDRRTETRIQTYCDVCPLWLVWCQWGRTSYVTPQIFALGYQCLTERSDTDSGPRYTSLFIGLLGPQGSVCEMSLWIKLHSHNPVALF